MSYVLGIDAGGTNLKVVLFDLAGHPRGSGTARCRVLTPRPGWMERDMHELWSAAAGAIRQCLDTAGIRPEEVAAVGVTGHGDGLYLVDERGQPVRDAILATDSRAAVAARQCATSWRSEDLLGTTGTYPHPSSQAPLLRWLADSEPESLDQTAWVLFCKDWLRLCLTGRIATDPSDAGASFLDIRTGEYDTETMRALDLGAFRDRLPTVLEGSAVAGEITPSAAAETGLAAGTPVVVGSHDVSAISVGVGAVEPGAASITMGTFGTNQVVGSEPVVGNTWQTRPFVARDRWIAMATSPTSASNLDWMLGIVGARDKNQFEMAMREVTESAQSPASLLFLPFLYGAPPGIELSGSFAGLKAWHTRADLLRAVMEGVVFTHRLQFEELTKSYPVDDTVSLTGGGARNPFWSQMIADCLGRPVRVTESTEVGALGAAIVAGVGVGVWPSLHAATSAVVRTSRIHDPDAARRRPFDDGYARFQALIDALPIER